MAEKKKETKLQAATSIAFIIFVVLLIRTLLWEPFRIPSESMLPRLEVGDFISVNKAAYGWSKRSPTFFDIPFVSDGRLNPSGSEPKRGDVIVFRNHQDGDTITIKRLIGLPGDVVEIQADDQVIINGEALKREAIEGSVITGRLQLDRFWEELPDGRRYIIYQSPQRRPLVGKYTVPAKSYFLLGDNRDNSKDSRFFGAIEETHLLGRANLINLNLFQSLKGKRLFLKMQESEKNYDEYIQKHTRLD